MRIIRLDSVGSTNSWIRENLDQQLPLAVIAREQTAGRGQRGNTWEAAPGMNVTMSVALRPDGIAPRDQFAISRAVSLAIVDTLRDYLPDECQVTIKWPNDIYVGNRKICGILIENVLSGNAIIRSIIGIGINVNQRVFESSAPNPVSIAAICGRDTSIAAIAAEVITRIERYIVPSYCMTDDNMARYRATLYRRQGIHRFELPDGRAFMASIESVDSSGLLHLRHTDDTLTIHPFKSVIFPIDESVIKKQQK